MDQILAAHSAMPGVAVAVVQQGRMVDSTTAGTGLTEFTPLRIASVTKSYVAATLITLAEQQGISLDDPVSGILPPAYADLLEAHGYDSSAISLKHLLAHNSGLTDHTESEGVKEFIMQNPGHAWTAREQVELAMSMEGPLFPPGSGYQYSDTGYVLLGQTVERLAAEPLHAAVRGTLKLGEIGLNDTWWELKEQPPAGVPQRAVQYMDGFDANTLSGTIDLYGGGGLMASAADLALFFNALMEGRIVSATVLETMLDSGVSAPDEYRLGLARIEHDGLEAFGHSGYWGTGAWHYPALEVTVAVACTEREGSKELMDEVVRALPGGWGPATG